MKVLRDHCVPRRFRRLLIGHEVRTAFEMGRSERNLLALPLPVAVIVANDNRFATLEPYAPTVLNWLSGPMQRRLVRIESTGQVTPV